LIQEITIEAPGRYLKITVPEVNRSGTFVFLPFCTCEYAHLPSVYTGEGEVKKL
jgi:hypothetical protein